MKCVRESTALRWPSLKVVENGNFMPLIQQELGANAPDVARAANHKDFHWREKCSVIGAKSKATRQVALAIARVCSSPVANLKPKCAGEYFARRFCPSSFRELRPSSSNTIMFATRGENFQTFFLRTPLQNVDVDIADTPVSYLRPAGLIKIDSVGADQSVPVIVDDVFFASINEAKARSERVSRPI